MNCEQSLMTYLEGLEKPNANERRALRVLRLPENNRRRQRFVDHVEATATTQLRHDGKVSATGKVNWAKTDWASLLATIMPMILAFLKALGLFV